MTAQSSIPSNSAPSEPTFKSRAFMEDRISWAVLLTAVLGFSYWKAFLAHHFVVDLPAPKSTLTRWPTIVGLEYDRVVGNDTIVAPGAISIADLEKHLRVLRERGYEPISIKSLEDFYFRHASLPEKSVLLTFDNAFFTYGSLVTPLLVKSKIPAVLTFSTDRIESRDTAFLFWDRIREMVGSGVWEIALSGKSMSHKVVVGPNGEMGAFHGSRAWKSSAGRFENTDEFRDRVRSDYREAIALTSSNIEDADIAAFAAPLGPSWYRDLDPEYAAIDAAERTAAFSMGFTDDLFGANGRTSLPGMLKRQRGTSRLSAFELDTWLAGFESMTSRLTGPVRNTAIFFDSEGRTHTGSVVIGSAGSSGSSKTVRLPFPESSGPWAFTFDLDISEGSEVWLTKRARSSGREMWRAGVSSNSVAVQELRSGRFENVRTAPISTSFPARVSLALVRGGLTVRINESEVFETPISVLDDQVGELELAAWHPQGSAKATVSSSEVTRLPRTFRAVHTTPRQAEIDSFREISSRPSDNLVAGWRVFEWGIERIDRNEDLLRMIEHRFAAQLSSVLCLNARTSVEAEKVAMHAAGIVKSYPTVSFVVALPQGESKQTKDLLLHNLRDTHDRFMYMEDVLFGADAPALEDAAREACSRNFTES